MKRGCMLRTARNATSQPQAKLKRHGHSERQRFRPPLSVKIISHTPGQRHFTSCQVSLLTCPTRASREAAAAKQTSDTGRPRNPRSMQERGEVMMTNCTTATLNGSATSLED